MKIYFLLVRRIPPVASPVLLEVFARLRGRGFDVKHGIPEEMVLRPAELTVTRDLYVLKSHTELSLSLAGVLHHQGARLLNPYPNCLAVQNKIVASRILRSWEVPTPDCWVTGDLRLLLPVVRRRPLILKPYLGHRGQGLHVVRNASELESLPPPQSPVLIQEYVESTSGDLKVYVVGEQVFAVRKKFSPSSFTESGAPCAVSAEVRDVALRCGRALGLGLYGVDLVEGRDRPWVVDVNTFPGYKGVPDVAPLIADYIAAYATGELTLPQVSLASRSVPRERHGAGDRVSSPGAPLGIASRGMEWE